MRRAAIIAADAQSCYRPLLPGMAIYADGVPMTTDRLLGVLALAIGGALGWLMFGRIMATATAHSIGVDTIVVCDGQVFTKPDFFWASNCTNLAGNPFT